MHVRLKWVLRLIGPVIIVVILFHLDLKDVWQSIIALNPFYLLLAVIFQLASYVLKSVRWQVLISLYQDLSFFDVFEANVHGNLYATFTPAKIGEGFKAALIKNSKLTYPQIFFSIVVDRMLDVMTIALAGYIGLIFLREALSLNAYVLPAVTIGLLAAAALSYYISRFTKKSGRFEHAGRESGMKKWLYDNLISIMNNILAFSGNRRVNRARVISVNIILYLFYFMGLYFMVLSLGLEIPFTFIVLSFSVVALLGILPITVSGIGTRDVSLIFFFSILGIAAEKAIAVSLLNLVFMDYGIILLCLALVTIINSHKLANKEIPG